MKPSESPQPTLLKKNPPNYTGRRCPVRGCDDSIARENFMCRRHWRMVPRPLQRQVNEAWSIYQDALREHARDGMDYRRAAIAGLRAAQQAAARAVEALNV